MKTLLVATDFSSTALNATNYAVDMALSIKANILLVHVFNIPVSFSEIPVEMNAVDMLQYAENNINALKEQLTRRTGGKINIETEVTRGFFSEELKNICERKRPYAVVIGSHGMTGAKNMFFGGHAVYAMKHLLWPIIAVPPEAKFTAIKKIGLALDFDRVADTTPIGEIKMLVNDYNAELHVINTGKKGDFNPDVVFGPSVLDTMLEPVKPNYHFITNKKTDEGIVDFAEKNQIDLLIVLPKRHGLLDKLIHMSNTKKFVIHSHVPVMALHQ